MELLILATEGGIPTSNPWSQLAVPLGIVIFVGAVYMLLRSNLGTRRGYLVMGSSLWAFGFLLALFWAFGAPGTPANTGPQNLPGQELDEYQPVWVPFAQDSTVATEDGSPYTAAADYPSGWGDVPGAFSNTAQTGVANITSFFGSTEAEFGFNILAGTEALAADPLYAEADNGRPMIAVTLVNTCQFVGDTTDLPPYCTDAGLEIGDPIPEGAVDENGDEVREEQTFFGFYDAGAPYFPSLLMIGIMLVLFLIHIVLLGRDELREKREAAAVADEEVQVEEKAPVGV